MESKKNYSTDGEGEGADWTALGGRMIYSVARVKSCYLRENLDVYLAIGMGK
jgi:hypothetical protein